MIYILNNVMNYTNYTYEVVNESIDHALVEEVRSTQLASWRKG